MIGERPARAARYGTARLDGRPRPYRPAAAPARPAHRFGVGADRTAPKPGAGTAAGTGRSALPLAELGCRIARRYLYELVTAQRVFGPRRASGVR